MNIKTIRKTVIGLIVGFWFLILWASKTLLSSDIPVVITPGDTIVFLLCFLVSTAFTVAYIHFTRNGYLHMFLAFPTLLWALSTAQVFSHYFHPYDSFMSVVGLIGSLLMIVWSIIKQKRDQSQLQ